MKVNDILKEAQRVNGSFEEWKTELPKHTTEVKTSRSPDGYGVMSVAYAKRQFGGVGPMMIVGKYFHDRDYGIIEESVTE